MSAPPPGFPSIDYIADWPGRLEGLLYEQFKNDLVLKALARDVLGPQVQDLEDSGQSLLTITDIDRSEGVNLDVLGRIIGQPRGGVDDLTYRLYLKARVRANKSSGNTDDLYAVFFLLYGDGAGIRVRPFYPAALELRVNNPITAAQAAVGLQFLTTTKMAGVQAIFQWQEDVGFTPPVFRMADGEELAQAAFGGDERMIMWSTQGWPPADTIVIDGGLATEETIDYLAIENGIGLVLAAPLAFSHAIGALVERVDDGGAGFGDELDPTVGGEFGGDATA